MPDRPVSTSTTETAGIVVGSSAKLIRNKASAGPKTPLNSDGTDGIVRPPMISA